MQDMMHCLHPSILERKRAQLQWQQQQESNNNNNNFSIESLLSMQGDGWPSLTSSAPYPIGIRDEERGTTTTNTTPIPTPTTSNVSNSISSKKKRKADNRAPMEGGDDDGEKRMKKGDEGSEGEKKQREDENNGKKVDYIHVRARRGQATDSHSLAERVRRERISERMKYLQGLVPGCDKVTGKAGMLDEIINYVQSLQRQVEFLSMKLATVNPRPDLDIETLISKEMMNNVLACNSHSIHNNNNSNNNSSSSMGIMQEMMLDPSLLLHLSSMQQSMAINPVDLIALQRSTISMPEPFILDSCFNAMQRTSSGWDSEVHSLSGVEFHQGRSSPFLFQSLQGNVLPNNPKMEM